MRVATFVLAAALLAGGAAAFTQPAYPIPPNPAGVNVLNMSVIVSGIAKGVVNLPGRFKDGTFVVAPPGQATPKEEVTDVGCLNTVIPPPLNWGPLWCAGKDAKVQQWIDEVGTLHRTIDIPVQPNVTANMVFWLFSPLYPQFLEFSGKMWFWYHLWHPLDHIMAANAAAPSSANPLLPALYTLIHEHYRNTEAEKGKQEFETDAWFHVDDLFSNWLKKRIVISVNTLGMQAWTLIVNLKDTPAGLKVDNELILGAAAAGYDKADPSKGAPLEAAKIVNDNLIHPMLDTYATGAEFNRSINAITRHVIEEFSMFRFFLPQVWNKFPHLQGMFALADAFNSFVPRLNYGPHMFGPAMNTAGLTELMMPLNRAALVNKTQLAGVVRKVPGAVAAGLAANVNSQLAGVQLGWNSLAGALGSANKTAAAVTKTVFLKAVPSAAGAYQYRPLNQFNP